DLVPHIKKVTEGFLDTLSNRKHYENKVNYKNSSIFLHVTFQELKAGFLNDRRIISQTAQSTTDLRVYHFEYPVRFTVGLNAKKVGRRLKEVLWVFYGIYLEQYTKIQRPQYAVRHNLNRDIINYSDVMSTER
ncbi:hypothetical protein L9F63_022301, partial [Diploptera punctata]